MVAQFTAKATNLEKDTFRHVSLVQQINLSLTYYSPIKILSFAILRRKKFFAHGSDGGSGGLPSPLLLPPSFSLKI